MPLIRPTNPKVIQELAEKQKKLKKSEPAMKKGGSIMVRIQNICEAVQKRLGHYKDQLELIQTKERLHEYITSAIEKGIISIDTETTGLDPITDQIVGACIYTREEKPAYIPINHIDYITGLRVPNQLTEKEVAEEFKRLVDAKTKAIYFNAKFDIRVMRWQLGVDIPPAHCGFIAGKCLKEDEPEGNLKFLWKKYCCPPDFDEPALTFDKMFEGLKFNLIPISTAYLYAAKDAKMTLELYDFQMQYLDENNPKCQACHLEKVAKLYREIELPIISIVADIEDQGVVIDAVYGEKLSKEYNQKLKEAEEEFVKELANYQSIIDDYMAQHPESKLENPVNINSPTQLSELFYDVLKQPVISKKDPKGTGKDILKAMNHPLCKPILAYKEIAKLVSTYIDNLPKMVNKRTGRLHCNFNQYGANCCHYDTLVTTDKGLQKIGDIVNNITDTFGEFADADIKVLNKDRVFENANKVIKYQNVDTIKIKGLYGFEIEGTPNHKVIVSKITEKDWNRNHSKKQKRNFWSEKYFKQLDQIQIGDYIEVPCGWLYPDIPLIPVPFRQRALETHNKRDLSMPNYYDEVFAEFLGMYHADGSIKDKDGFIIQISNSDIDVRNRVMFLGKQLFNVEGNYYDDKRTNGGSVSFRVTHAESLKPLFCRGANNKRIPDAIKQSNERVIKAYIKGMTLDSTVKRDRIRITISNKDDARFIQMFLCSQGILSCVRSSKHLYKNGGELHFIIISGDYWNLFLDKIGVVQSRKNIRNEKAQEHYKNVLIGDSFRIRVTEIEHSKNDVYDLHVPDTHSYLSNGMISHNTGRFSCIAEGTPIRLVGEEKPIEEVKEGDLVYCYDTDKNTLTTRKVTQTWDKGNRECLCLTIGLFDSYAELICTPNHQIYTPNGWIETGKLNINDTVYSAQDIDCGQENHGVVVSITPIGERHVYDIEVEDFHNFIANEICVHNSSNPNFQNLPSKNHDIRLMFTAARVSAIEEKEGKFSLYIEDLVPTVEGDKNSQDLKEGDILVCEDGKFPIKKVEVNDVYVDVFI